MNILFVNLLLIGDVINTAHVAGSLHKCFKDVNIDLLTFKGNHSLAKLCKPFSQIYTLDREKNITQLFRSDLSAVSKYCRLKEELKPALINDYDLVVNITHNKLSAVICSLVKAENKIGVLLNNNKKIELSNNNPWLGYFNDFVTRNIYNSFQYVDVFKEILEIPQSKNSFIEKSKETQSNFPHEDYFIVKPTTSEMKKNWGDENYSDLAKLLINRLKTKCLIVGTSEEEERLVRVAETIGEGAEVGIFSMDELAGIIQDSRFVIGGDTGILHLAAAMGKRVYTITLGPGTYFKSTPYGSGNYIFYPGEKCYPCAHLKKCSYNRKCRKNINPVDVMRGILGECINSVQCGVLKTYYDENGFLSFEKINKVFKDDKYDENMLLRAEIRDYLKSKKLKYNFNKLFSSLRRKLNERNNYIGNTKQNMENNRMLRG